MILVSVIVQKLTLPLLSVIVPSSPVLWYGVLFSVRSRKFFLRGMFLSTILSEF